MGISVHTSLERKYILAASYRFDAFKQKSPNLYNCRCVFCGDSENLRKKRGYFYLKEHHWYYNCKNCGIHVGIKKLLLQLDYRLYQEYMLESFQTKKSEYANDPIHKSKVAVTYDPDPATHSLRSLPKISQLDHNHRAKKYITDRLIPNPMHTILRWCPDFMSWTNSLKPDKFSEAALKFDHGRVIIPFFSADNKFFAYLGRAIDGSEPRYILIILNHDIPLLYGMNTVDRKKRIYVVEGPIDAFFISNSIALGGSNLSVLTNVEETDKIIIFDNEPHSKEAFSKIEHAIDLGYKVCIWPSWLVEKDINSMVMHCMSSEYIQSLIDDRTYSGLAAKIKLAEWSKV